MSDVAIRIENLGKRYRYGGPAAVSHNFREDVMEWLRGVLPRRSQNGGTRPLASATSSTADPSTLNSPPSTFREVHEKHIAEDPSYFWALRDINLDIKQGEVVGIIGRNGAGKSTLLKILSRITPPTTGKITYNGRIASLLEVGTGFHRELTGRENIFLNGSILGMKRAEIAKKFDEIVAFAEIDKFIDTPVKFYSSGMYVRLAFAVAAHLEPEILVVDEVLAVGDADFQKKCLGKMGDVAKQGRTILFVSHNMSAISELCQKAMLLTAGRVDLIGSVDAVVGRYSMHAARGSSVDLSTVPHASRPQEYGILTHLSIFDKTGTPATTYLMGQSIVAKIGVHIHRKMPNAEIGFKISSRMGNAIHYFCSTWEGFRRDLDPGDYLFEIQVPKIMLLPAKYILGAWLAQERRPLADDYVPDISVIEIIGDDFTGNRADFARYSISGCEVYAPSQWKMLEARRTHSNVA
jgi:lipopolysaccharide transport system ATP-binding protein